MFFKKYFLKFCYSKENSEWTTSLRPFSINLCANVDNILVNF